MMLGAEELAAIAAEWRNARLILPIYQGIVQRFSLEAPACQELESPVDCAEPEAIGNVRRWLQEMDELIQVHQLRLFLQTSTLSTEGGLRALIGHYRKKETRSPADRDKLDFLLVQYFAQCAPATVLHEPPSFADVGSALAPALGAAPAEMPGWLKPLEDLLRRMAQCRSLRDLLRQGILYEMRKIKVSADEAYFGDAELVAFARVNFLVRQTFFRLIHADVDAIRLGVRQLQERGVAAINCKRAQLSPEEPLASVLETARQWKKPFQAEYSAGNPLAQLSELRTAVDEAVSQQGIAASKPLPAPAREHARRSGPEKPAGPVKQPPAATSSAASAPSSVPAGRAPVAQRPPVTPSRVSAPAVVPSVTAGRASTAARQSAPMAGSVPAPSPASKPPPVAVPVSSSEQMRFTEELAAVLVQLSEYLRAAQVPSRTMGATIVLGQSRLALSSWEVKAFIDTSGDLSRVIQQGVGVRVLLFQVLEQARQHGSGRKLAATVVLARSRAVRVEDALAASRAAGEVEATVVLSATAQRLATMLEEAEEFLRSG